MSVHTCQCRCVPHVEDHCRNGEPDPPPEVIEKAARAWLDYEPADGEDDPLGNCMRAVLAAVADDLRAEGAACCCETSPPEFGGPIPERDCPLHGEPAYQRGMVEGARQVVEAVEDYYHTDGGSQKGYVYTAREAVARIEGGRD